MQFERLPHELNRSIGSFLDYNSRIEFSRVLTDPKDVFMRKLDSDAHNLNFNVQLVKRIMDGMQMCETIFDQARVVYNLLDYFANTEDTILLDVKSGKRLREKAIQKATEFADQNSAHYANSLPYYIKDDLLMIATAALHRLQTHVPRKILDVKSQAVEIV